MITIDYSRKIVFPKKRCYDVVVTFIYGDADYFTITYYDEDGYGWKSEWDETNI